MCEGGLVRGGGVGIRGRVALTGRIKSLAYRAMLLDRCQSGDDCNRMAHHEGGLSDNHVVQSVRDSFFDMLHRRIEKLPIAQDASLASSRRRHGLL